MRFVAASAAGKVFSRCICYTFRTSINATEKNVVFVKIENR